MKNRNNIYEISAAMARAAPLDYALREATVHIKARGGALQRVQREN